MKKIMKMPARNSFYFSRPLLQVALTACMLLIALIASEAQAAITVTRTSSPVFYTDSGTETATTSPRCTYLSFNITSTTAISDAWVTLGNFGGAPAYLSLGGGDTGAVHFGSFAAGQTSPAYYYVCSSYTGGGITAAQTYNVTTFSGNPLNGGTSLGLTSFSTTIDDGVIQANSNSVNSIWADINPSVLGATTTLTVDGDTGTIGCVNPPSACSSGGGGTKGPLTFNPATFTNWRADSYELVATSIVLSVGNSGTYNNVLYIDNVASGSNTHYVATYYFRPVSTTSSTTTLSPVSYLASGTQIKHTSLNSGAYAAAGGLLPILPAQNAVLLAKSVSHATLPAQGGVVTYTLSATNSGAYDVNLDSFIDNLPAGATYVTGSSTYNGVSIANPTISGSTLTWSSLFDIPAGTTRTLIFQVTLPATPGTFSNTATARIGYAIIDTTLSTSDNVPPTATTVVLKAPAIGKAFSPSTASVSGISALTLTITNPNATHTLNGIAVSDTLPTGLTFTAPSGAATTCPGAILSAVGTTLSINGSTLNAGQSCTVSVNVTSAVAATYNNITSTVSSSNGGNGGTAAATITFSPKPTISKSFSVATMPRNGTATLTFTITNSTAAAITGVTFDDLFPPGLVTANPPALSPASPCGGTLSSWNGTSASALSATGGDAGVRLTGGAIASTGGTCTFSIRVTSSTAGIYANTSSGVNSNESSPAGTVSNTATLSVLAPPTVSKAFSPSTIGSGQTSILTITLTNPNATPINGATFTDIYPVNVNTAAIPNASTSCTSGTVNSTASSVSLSGATIPASGSCTVRINVTSSVINLPGYVNTIAAGGVTTTNAGSNATPASGTLIVNATPTIAKSFAFNPATGLATMNITITNNDTAAITGLSFTDLFPTNLVTDSPPSVTPATPCGAGSSIQSWDGATAGTLSATGNDFGIKLTAGQLTASGSCTFSINLTANSLGIFNNQTSGATGSFTGTGNPSNIATWIAPSVSKTFSPKIVGPGNISRLVISFTNPSLTTTLTGLSVNDTYPTSAQLPGGGTLAAAITSPTPNASNTCGGTVTATLNGISLSGGTLSPGASCSIGADVLASNTTSALYTNTTGKVGSNQGIGIVSSDSLLITTSPTLTKSFLTNPVTLTAGTATSVMRITVVNNSGLNITGVSFSDIFPTSPAPMSLASTTVINSCGGTITDLIGNPLAIGSTGIKLTGGAITAAALTCTIDVTVRVSATGSFSNTTSGALSSVNTIVGPVSNTAILVANLPAPTVTKTFANSGFQVDGTNRLTITLTNPNTTAITGVNFTDIYPANLQNAATPNLANTCAGTATAAAGSGTLSISGGIIPPAGSCTIQVDLTASTVGSYTNTLPINAVTSSNANKGPVTAVSASTTAYLPPSLTKSFGAASLASGGTTTLTLALTNPAGNPAALNSIRVDDTFPAGLTLRNTTFSYTPAACGTVTKITGAASSSGDNNIRFSVVSLAAGTTCQVSVNVTSTTLGVITNTTNAPIATAPAALTGIPASSNLSVTTGPSITLLKTVAIYSDPLNGTTNPKFIPGAVAQYTIIASNSGGPADNNSTIITDPIPPNTSLYVSDIGGIGSGPVLFSQGTTSSTLTYIFGITPPPLADPADDIDFSNNGGATWTAIPAAGANGCDPTITHIRIKPKGSFAGNPSAPSPSFQLSFRVCVK